MTDDELREVLRQVAQGELDPDEAARLLDDGDGPEGDETDEDGFAGATNGGERARRLRIAGRARKIRVVGDPGVHEVLLRGGHSTRREGDVIQVDCDPEGLWGEDHLHGLFAMVGAGPWMWGRGRDWEHRERDWERRERDWERRAARWERRRRTGPPPGFGSDLLEVRANPDLDLELDLVAGSVRCSDMSGPIKCSMTAGSVVLTGVHGPLECSVNAGSLAVHGPIATGDSRIDCDMGTVKVRLDPGADVRLKVDTDLGRADVRLGESTDRTEHGEWVVGAGTASLAIASTMGSVRVRGAAGATWA